MDAVFFQFVPQGMKSALKGSIEAAKPTAKVAAAEAICASNTVEFVVSSDMQALIVRVEQLEKQISSLADQVHQLMIQDMPPLVDLDPDTDPLATPTIVAGANLLETGDDLAESVSAATEIDDGDSETPIVIVQNVPLRSINDVNIINLEACTLPDLHAIVQYLYDTDKDTSNLLARSKKMKRVKLIAGIKALLE
jgi:hypothetical protein